MEQHEGFIAPDQERKECKLVKSLYGLKQAPKQWHENFDSTLKSNNFKINESSDGITLSQSHYVESILRKFNAFDSPPAKTPVDLSLHLAKNRGEPVSQLEYVR
ncbi:hypothetical protein DH2020_016572 [Rehmannia glutinosa]|uniref:Reverse transcriptase Ty1/copia-type domain-containing protein n=1 Tax=Rehmannia glutinosa TaxID=99300 RepID=A0ABR0WNN5_REHGL